MSPLAVTAATATTACGLGLAALDQAFRDHRSGLRRHGAAAADDTAALPIGTLDTWIGRVDAVESVVLPDACAAWDCRNNRLAWLALQQDGVLDALRRACAQYGPDRVAVIVGTSTSSIGASEEAYRRLTDSGAFPHDLARPIVHTPHSLGSFLQAATGAAGPVVTVASIERIGQYVGSAPRFDDIEQAEAYLRVVCAPFGALSDEQWRHLTENAVIEVEGGLAMAYDPGIGEPFRKNPLVEDVDLWPVYDAIRCPTMVMRGAESDLLERETAEEMSRRGPCARVVEVADVGHAPMLLDEVQIGEVRDFLLAQ